MTRPVYNFVAEVAFQTSATTTDTRYAAKHGITTTPMDTPADTHMPGRLKSAGSFRQELFSSARMTGAVRPSVGELVLYNDDGALDDWVNLGTAGGKVTVSMGLLGAAYPAGFTTVFVAYIVNVLADFTEVRLRLRDRSYRLDKPVVSDAFLGNGDLEGPTGFARKKPLAILDPGLVEPILVDAQRQIYYVQANAVDAAAVAGSSSAYQVYQDGELVSRGANYTSEAQLLYTAPAAAQVRFWFGRTSGAHYRGPVYMRLGTPATGDIRVRPFGYVMDPADSVHSTAPGAWTMTSMCRRGGLYDVTPASMPAGLNDDRQIASQYITDERTYLDVLQSAAFQNQNWFGFDRLDRFCSARVGSPSVLEAGESYAATLGLDTMRNIARGYLSDMEGPVWQVAINAGETWSSNVKAGIDDSVREELTRNPWQASLIATADSVRYQFANAVEMQLDTPARISPADLVARYFLLFGQHRDLLSFEIQLTPANLALDLNDPVQVLMPRFGCAAGRHFRICVLDIDIDAAIMRLSVWGGPAWTTEYYVLGGGTAHNGGGGIGSEDQAESRTGEAQSGVVTLTVTCLPGEASSPARTGSASGVTATVTLVASGGVASGSDKPLESLVIACGDESTACTTGTAKVTFRMPYAFKLMAVRGGLTVAPTGSTFIFDINESGTSVLSTKLSIDAGEKTSATAASAAVISDRDLAEDAEMTIDFDQVGSTVAGAGPKVALIGYRV